MSVAAVHECTPESVMAHVGKMFSFSCDTAAALMRAVAVVAEGEDIETPFRPRLSDTDAGDATATDMQQEIASILAVRREAQPQRVRDRGQDHGRGRFAGRLLVKRPSSTSK
jgi:hypothetical protein